MKQQQQGPKQPQQQQQGGDGSQVEGEGSYTATRRHRESAEQFVQSGQVDKAAHEAAPKDEAEAEELKKAEQAGVSHAKR